VSTIQPKPSLFALGAHRTMADLTATQRWLLEVMREHQFGRIESLRIEGGQPVPDQRTRIVRSARLGANDTKPRSVPMTDYELGKPILDLLAELVRLGNGAAERIEFRYGEPCLIEVSGRFCDTEVDPSLSG
jgi:hypothetical protein